MSKIFISVSGGCVQEVLSTNAKDEVELWDWDNIKADKEDVSDLEIEYDVLSKGLSHIL